MKHLSISLAYASTLTSLTAQNSITIEQLTPTTVTAQSPDFFTDLDTSEQRLKTIPGAASVITADDLTGRTIRPAEIFQFDPTVYAQSSGTANDTRLSIRGSGAQRKYGNRGLTILQDGIPANHADGSFYTRIIDPLTLAHTEVFAGANGQAYGANQLGGAINFVQKNGLNSTGTQATVEYGSFETIRAALQHGEQSGNWDYFAGYTYAESDGYRDHQEWQTHHFTTNLGYQWSDSAATRLYFLFSDSDGKLPGSLTEAEFNKNPEQRSPGRDDRTDRDLSTIRIAQRTAWEQENANYSFYTYYQYLDFDHLTGIGNFKFNNLIDYDTDEFGIGFAGENSWFAFNLEQTLHSTASYDYGRNEIGGFSGFVTPGRSPAINAREERSNNLKVYLENETDFGNGSHFYVGAGWVQSYRSREKGPRDTRDSTIDFSEEQDGGIWRVGYLKDVSDDLQVFANVSQSFEAAPFSEASDNVSPQKALTYEVGTRFEHDWVKGSITGFYAKVDGEFIDQELNPGSSGITNEDTIHQGIEAFISVDLTSAFGFDTDYSVSFEQSYQLNDFTFDEGFFDSKQLPGIANQVYAGRIRVTAPENKWNTSISADWLANDLVANNTNDQTATSYIAWRIAGEYAVNEHLTLYGGIDNLFDKGYASSVTINSSNDSYLNPADGRSAYLGARMSW